MPALHTVYDFADESMHLTFLLPLAFTAVGIYNVAFALGLTDIYIKELFRFKTKNRAIVNGLLVAIVSGFISLFIYHSQNKTYNQIHRQYQLGNFSEIEGKVINYHSSTDQAHDPERFDVDSVHFEFYDVRNDKESYGYNTTQRGGGVLRPSLYVRIRYYNNGNRNVILKVETE